MAFARQQWEEKYAKEIHSGDTVVVNRRLSQKTRNDMMPEDAKNVKRVLGKTSTVEREIWIPGNRFDRTRGGYMYVVDIDGEKWNFGKGDLKKIQ